MVFVVSANKLGNCTQADFLQLQWYNPASMSCNYVCVCVVCGWQMPNLNANVFLYRCMYVCMYVLYVCMFCMYVLYVCIVYMYCIVLYVCVYVCMYVTYILLLSSWFVDECALCLIHEVVHLELGIGS